MMREQGQTLSPTIFRAYDIRGVVGETLTEDTVFLIGKALGTIVQIQGESQLVVARDGRVSADFLAQALCQGIQSSGCDVIDIGQVPTPLLYYATHVFDMRSGVMLTGSHNPPEYNGLKMVVGGKTLTEENIQAIYQRIVDEKFYQGHGSYYQAEMAERYIDHIRRQVPLARPLKVVVDAGSGVTGKIAPALYRALGCEVEELYCEINGLFPHHHPDPSQVENLQDLIRVVREKKADIGLAFDGDGDRLGVVTPQGKIIWPDRLLMLFAKAVLATRPGGKIIYDVKCTHYLAPLIQSQGGEALMWKTGHSFIKAKLAETQAVLAGEMSGHFFFKDRWYGFDDGVYAGARLLQILASHAETADELFDAIPNSVNTPELKVAVVEEEKFSLMQQLIDKADFAEAQDMTAIDGLRIHFAEGWGLVRPSNTTPCLVLRFEASDGAMLEKIQGLFRGWMLSVKPDLVLPF